MSPSDTSPVKSQTLPQKHKGNKIIKIHRGSYISAHILLIYQTSWRKEIKCEACRAFYLFFATSLINSIIQEHEC